jgi:hypothetical protein
MLMKTTFRVSAALAATMLVLGCKETTSSEFIRTGGIAALIDITAEDADNSKVHVELRVGGDESNTFVILDGGDKLTASAGATETKDLFSVAEGVYEGKFATGKEVEFTVAFDRTEDEDAPNSKGTLPPPFAMTSPMSDETHSRADDNVLVTWSPVPDSAATIDVTGDCIFSESYSTTGALGMFTIPKADLKSTDEMKPLSCTVTVTVKCKREGKADVAYDDESHFFTYQTRSTSFTSAP